MSAYEAALEYLFVRTTGQWRLGLERTEALLTLLGNPHRTFACIHVGGTNGKGSVCAILDALLRERGFRVARYTSPHLVSFRERMVVDGEPVSEDAVVRFVERWTPDIERIGATFFEATTAMAFHLFAEAKPDIAVIEVGLGGRLDATNVVDPVAAVVTSIGLDHAEYLGSTREAIAREKAGIFKRARPAIIGERDPALAALLEGAALAAGATPVSVVGRDTPATDVQVDANGTSFRAGANVFRTSLLGAHQADNAAAALRALELLPQPWCTASADAARALRSVALPGRFHRHGVYVFDVAHNEDGVGALARTLRAAQLPRPVVAVVSILRDKDWRGMLKILAPEVDSIVLTTAPTSPPNRAWDAEEVLREATRAGWRCVHEPDFDAALERGARDGETVLITGSFHTVGDAMARLHVSPLAR